MNWKDFLYFSPKERIGLLILIVFIVGVFAGKWLFTSKSQEAEVIENTIVQENATPDQRGESSNTPLSATVSRPQKQNPETKTYYRQEEPNSPPPKQYPKTEKYPAGTVIELNAADTTMLKKIPGIGSSYAKRIVGYRNLLGGYYDLEQLQEVYGMYVELYDRIIPYFHIDQTMLRKIQINQASLDQLKAHPYINFYQAKAIIEVRKKQGKVNSIDELSLLEEFTEEDWERIIPYLSFE